MLRGKDAPYRTLADFVLDLKSPFETGVEDIKVRDEEELGIQNKVGMKMLFGV